MRVVMVTFDDLRCNTRLDKEVTALAQAGYDVVVIGYRRPNDSGLDDRPGYRKVQIRSLLIKMKALRWVVGAIELSWKILKEAWKADGDVYHCHCLEPMLVAWTVARLKKRALVYDAREFTPFQEGYSRYSWLVRYLLLLYDRAMSRAADITIAANHERAHLMEHLYGLKKVEVIENYPYVCELVEGVKRATDSRYTLVYAGLVREDRGLDILLKAASRLPQVRIMIIGAGEQLQLLQSLAAELGIAERVVFHDPVPHEKLMEFLQNADVGVALIRNTCLNNYLAAPSKIYDYMMSGLAVLTSDFPALSTRVCRFRVGEVANPERIDEVYEALCRLLGPELTSMKARARRVAEERFNWDKESKKLIQLYSRLRVRR